MTYILILDNGEEYSDHEHETIATCDHLSDAEAAIEKFTEWHTRWCKLDKALHSKALETKDYVPYRIAMEAFVKENPPPFYWRSCHVFFWDEKYNLDWIEVPEYSEDAGNTRTPITTYYHPHDVKGDPHAS